MSFIDEYNRKKCTPEQLAGMIGNNWTCCTDLAAAIPPAIMDAMARRLTLGDLKGVTLHTHLDLYPMPYLADGAVDNINPVSWFSGGSLRKAINVGKADIMPCYYRDMPRLFSQYTDLDAFFIDVSPMDEFGYFSCGTDGSISEMAVNNAKHIFLEVNKNMPRSLTAPMIHISRVTALCENDAVLPITPVPEIDEISKTIGGYIATEIPDGATIQLGIGAVPEAVGNMLKDKKDLGIHTELFTDSMVELIECGAVTNERKPVNKGQSVATLAFGSERMYRYINNNPAFVIKPVDYTNDPMVIAQHPDFISINAALEVDFFGQVCAESMGTMHMSGSGGQADYVRGAVLSKGGKSFIAFPSTAKGGKISRIKPTLTPGAVVTTSKNDVDYIVTEYGVAKLRGQTVSQRTKALIQIAHPDFRDELVFEARKRFIIV